MTFQSGLTNPFCFAYISKKFPCNTNTHAVHSKVALKYSVARSKRYISLSTLLTILSCYTEGVYTSKVFDAS